MRTPRFFTWTPGRMKKIHSNKKQQQVEACCEVIGFLARNPNNKPSSSSQWQLGACRGSGQHETKVRAIFLTCSQAAELSWPCPGPFGKKHLCDKQEFVSMGVERRNDRTE